MKIIIVIFIGAILAVNYSIWSITMTLSADIRRSISRRKLYSICSSESLRMRSDSEKSVHVVFYHLRKNELSDCICEHRQADFLAAHPGSENLLCQVKTLSNVNYYALVNRKENR